MKAWRSKNTWRLKMVFLAAFNSDFMLVSSELRLAISVSLRITEMSRSMMPWKLEPIVFFTLLNILFHFNDNGKYKNKKVFVSTVFKIYKLTHNFSGKVYSTCLVNGFSRWNARNALGAVVAFGTARSWLHRASCWTFIRQFLKIFYYQHN